MRRLLKNQILIRTLLLIILTIGAVTAANIRSTIVNNRNREMQRLQELGGLVNESRFPFTSAVLENMKLLSGAEYVLVNDQGAIKSKTSNAPGEAPDNLNGNPTLPAAIVADGVPYYHMAVTSNKLSDRTPSKGLVHIYVPRESASSVFWQASKTPLTIAFLVLPLAVLVSYAMASRVTRPLGQLESRVRQIANRDITEMPDIQGSEEVLALSHSIQDMALKLQEHESQLRANERLRAMVQFGSSIAHHLRNSATGCKMAVQLLAGENRLLAESENYQVATRQLDLMNNYIKRFLLISKSADAGTTVNIETVNLNATLDNVVFLLSPSAKHLNVDLKIATEGDSRFEMSMEDAEQLMMNLITNAITAASRVSAEMGEQPGDAKERGQVAIQLRSRNHQVIFSVSDNGSGPPAEIVGEMFEPFVTGSREGTGLGLSLVSDIAKRVDGLIAWSRDNGETTFTFEFPIESEMSENRQ